MTAPPPSPESGRIEGGVHRLPLRVYYEDTDAVGIVYHANHLKFAERARTEMLRCLGLDHSIVRERFGLAFTVRRCLVDYLAPARLDDGLVIETRLVRGGGASLEPGPAGCSCVWSCAWRSSRPTCAPPACRRSCAPPLPRSPPGAPGIALDRGDRSGFLLPRTARPAVRWRSSLAAALSLPI
jgi:YbgC/YbaW family acyl-CoA thioester hydrolase